MEMQEINKNNIQVKFDSKSTRWSCFIDRSISNIEPSICHYIENIFTRNIGHWKWLNFVS